MGFKESLVQILGRMGCRKISDPDNIHQHVIEVARYELCIKPLGDVQAFVLESQLNSRMFFFYETTT